MEKKRVSVQIEGRSYSLITTDDEKYVQKVANEVLSHIRKAAQSTKQLDTRDCAVLAALNFCDDRNKALKKNKDYVEKAESEKSEHEKNSVSKEKKTSNAKNNMTEQSEDVPVNVLSNEAKKTEQELRNEKLLGYVPMTQFSLFDEDKK